MRIKLTSIMVDDQDKALRFYTEVLGFKKKHDIPVGEFRWITVTSPEGARRSRAGAGARCQSRRQGFSERDVRAGAFRWRPSRCRTSTPSSVACRVEAWHSRESRLRQVRSRSRCSRTRAGI